MEDLTIEVEEQAAERCSADSKAELVLNYQINDVPPWYLCIVLGFQHYMTMLSSVLAISLIVGNAVCMGEDNVAKGELLGTLFFVSGIVTILQSTVGSRLPIVQGGSFAILVPSLAIMKLDKWKCPTNNTLGSLNGTVTEANWSSYMENVLQNTTLSHTEMWQSRIRELQGAIIVASFSQIIIGFSGVVGTLMRYVGPLTIATTITLIGLSLVPVGERYSSGHWGIAFLTMALMALFSQYLRTFTLPCFQISCKKGEKKIRKTKSPPIQLFAVMLALGLSWLFCFVLTITDVLPSDPEAPAYKARTDHKLSALSGAKWFRFPYPMQWGWPTISVGAVLGILGGIFVGIIESIGDYYACARISGAPTPPHHAINRGIFIEGIGCLLAGLWGTGNGTTSYTQNSGALAITKVGSRRVIQYAGGILMLCGVLGKVGAFFVIIPDPVIGGLFIVLFGMVTAVGISNLQFVDMNSSRNMFIFGSSVLFGLAFPGWLASNEDVIKTGNEIVDQTVIILLTSSMFIGGILGFFLDNTIPGSDSERGLTAWREKAGAVDSKENPTHNTTYDLPFGMNLIRSVSCFHCLPLCPTYYTECEKYCCVDV